MTTPTPLAAAEDALRWRDLTDEPRMPRNMLMEWSVERKCCIGRTHPTPEGDAAIAAELERLRAEVERLKGTSVELFDEARHSQQKRFAAEVERDEARAERDTLRAAIDNHNAGCSAACDARKCHRALGGWAVEPLCLDCPRNGSIDAALRAAPPAAVRHIKSGGIYNVVAADAAMEADASPVVVYRGADGRTWVRPAAEFAEKFEAAPPAAPATITETTR